MKVYIAGKIRTENERENLEKIESLLSKMGFQTFLPHRDVGLCEDFKDIEKTFESDIKKGFKNVDLVVADLNGLSVGAGTAWELGYAYSKGIPAIGIKNDEPVEEALEYLSAIIIGSTKIVSTFEELENTIMKKFNLTS